MSSEFLIISIMEFAIIYTLNKQNNSIKALNNKILEQKSIIIQINNICENLSLIKTNYHYNNPDYSINYNYINSSIIILLFDLLLFIILISLYLKDYNNTYNILIIPIIILITIFINLLILYLNNILLNNNSLEINNKEEEIINKINEIDNNYMTKLMIIIDNDNNNDDNYNDNYINSSIDEYISNYAYLNHLIKLCIIKNKNNFINYELKNKLIKNKYNKLIDDMKTRLSNFNEIIPEIIKYELDEVNKDLEEYKKNLQIKINNLNEISQINSIIINFYN